jgi:2-C-methyl-D-erythritol 4-phosphate cytidylyltransferase
MEFNYTMSKKMYAYQTVAIIPAAGSGHRMNAGINKIWLPLAGCSILEYVLRTFQDLKTIDHIALATNETEVGEVSEFIHRTKGLISEKFSIVTGGKERQDSVAGGLNFFENWTGWHTRRKMVLIHDAARPLVTAELINIAIEQCLIYNAVGVAVPVKDTIKQVDEAGFVRETLDRSTLWAVQTPQVFDFELLSECYRQVSAFDHKFTDDCAVVEYCRHRVKLVEGSYENIKITTSEDLVLAEAIIRRRIADADRTGI